MKGVLRGDIHLAMELVELGEKVKTLLEGKALLVESKKGSEVKDYRK